MDHVPFLVFVVLGLVASCTALVSVWVKNIRHNRIYGDRKDVIINTFVSFKTEDTMIGKEHIHKFASRFIDHDPALVLSHIHGNWSVSFWVNATINLKALPKKLTLDVEGVGRTILYLNHRGRKQFQYSGLLTAKDSLLYTHRKVVLGGI